MTSFTIGSLFDGSGGFPLAAFMCGGVPVWASEIEPYPIAVTRSRFPYMKHLGSVTDVKGNEVEPVDVVTFGSPCQDLSVAGKRAGLKHEDNGDDETTRSGLFMEAVRIIKEMREATNGKYPKFALWENVPGAFSSNKGEDFRVVLEELIKIVEPSAVMPTVPPYGWPYADSYIGDGWSLAYRVFDAQYWGVPQRRRRIYLVLDLRGGRAREVLFEREGLRGDFAEGATPWKGTPTDVERGVGTADSKGTSYGFDGYNADITGDKAATLGVNCGLVSGRNGVMVECCIDGDKIGKAERAGGSGLGIRSGDKMYTLTAKDVHCVCYDARGNGDGEICSTITGDHENRITDYTNVICMATQQGGAEIMENKCPTITAAAGMSGNNQPVICLDRAFYNQGENALYDPQYYEDGIVPPIVARGPSAVCYSNEKKTAVYLVVRRLTPTECARLQGFFDRWGDIDHKTDFTDEEYRFWLTVRNTHAAINQKTIKDYTKKQMLTWYNRLHVDSSEYKLWGNGIAFPNALYVMQGIAGVLK